MGADRLIPERAAQDEAQGCPGRVLGPMYPAEQGPIVGPEVVTGSTRMKAGTATKLVLNTITTGAMIRLGKTYGNLMVDLRATNNKLIDRSQRIVMEVCGVSRDEATKLLERAAKSVKLAIVMQKRGVSREEAAQLLADNGGVIRRVTKDAPPPIMER